MIVPQGSQVQTDKLDKQSQQKQDKVTSPQAAAGAQDSPKVIIPPPPMVVERDSSSVSIPKDHVSAVSKYESQLAASTKIQIGSPFGYRRDPFTRRSKFHAGMDIHARWGDPVGASLAGVVSFVGWSHGYGNVVIVDHGGGVSTHYAHLSSFASEVGQEVERGTVIGYAGSTGRATSPHLHYEVRIDGSPIDPLETVALDPSSDFFKRISKNAAAANASAPDGTEPVKPAAAEKPAADKLDKEKSDKDVKSDTSGQERPRRVGAQQSGAAF
ncbi:MAG: M23 family metallopeptidase [Blastocatellia bacterium]